MLPLREGACENKRPGPCQGVAYEGAEAMRRDVVKNSKMKKEQLRAMTEELIREIEEEDIGISLYSTFYQTEDELQFFKKEDREIVLKTLKRLAEDSKRHKEILRRVIFLLEKKKYMKKFMDVEKKILRMFVK